jgi:hypothetical protein
MEKPVAVVVCDNGDTMNRTQYIEYTRGIIRARMAGSKDVEKARALASELNKEGILPAAYHFSCDKGMRCAGMNRAMWIAKAVLECL